MHKSKENFSLQDAITYKNTDRINYYHTVSIISQTQTHLTHLCPTSQWLKEMSYTNFLCQLQITYNKGSEEN